MPSRRKRLQLASELGMNESQVYKWFWEQRNKEDERQDEAKMAALKDFGDLSNEQKFEVFVNKALR